MNTSIPKKLFTIIITSLFVAVTSYAQIVYTNIKPNIILDTSGAFYNVDLNGDVINDFNFSYYIYSSQSPGCKGHYNVEHTAKAGVLNSNAFYSYRLDSGMTINSDLIWDSSGTLLASKLIEPDPFHGCVTVTKYTGSFEGFSPAYLGVRLRAQNHIYYGWIGVRVDKYVETVTILDYAFNSIPNQTIQAGQKTCQPPTVNVTANGALSFCEGDSVTLTAKGSGYEYQWKQNGKDIDGATSKKYIAKTAGTYKCEVTNSCGSKTSKNDTVTISCKGLFSNATSNERIISNLTQLTIIPNPFSNSTTISFSLLQLQKVSISIYDMNGRLIKTLADEQMQQGNHQLLWNVKDKNGSAIVSGMYVLKLQAGNNIQTKNISVVH